VSGPGEARTILLLHIISARPSEQPLMVRTFHKVYMELGSYFLFLQEQIKDIITRRRVLVMNGQHKHQIMRQVRGGGGARL
jgi:GTPase involved in cell partitioning and DNA repair